jgi:hypothetical protein
VAVFIKVTQTGFRTACPSRFLGLVINGREWPTLVRHMLSILLVSQLWNVGFKQTQILPRAFFLFRGLPACFVDHFGRPNGQFVLEFCECGCLFLTIYMFDG